MDTIKTSSFFNLDIRDLAKGAIMTAGGAASAIILDSFNKGSVQIEWVAIWHGALVAGGTYILKNLFSPSKEIAPGNPIAK